MSVKIDIWGNILPNGVGGYKWGQAEDLFFQGVFYLEEKESLSSTKIYDLQLQEPIKFSDGGWLSVPLWLYKNKVMRVEDEGTVSRNELILRIKHKVLKEEKLLEKIKKEVLAFENFEKLRSAKKRQRIPEAVRLFVWQRDGGRCAKCGSRENLEFDHIIPLSKGGSSAQRNVQLLCETCNREKGKNLA